MKKSIFKSFVALTCSFCLLANIGAFKQTVSAKSITGPIHLDVWNWYRNCHGWFYYECTLCGIPMYGFMLWDEDAHNVFRPNPQQNTTYYGYNYSDLVPVYVLEALIDISLVTNPPREQLVTVKMTDVNKKVSKDLNWIYHYVA